MENFLYWLAVGWTTLISDIQSWIKFTFWWNYEQRKYYWWAIGLDIRVIGELIWNQAQDAANDVVDTVEDYADGIVEAVETWADGAIKAVEEIANNAVSSISTIWDSITALWTRFGADLLDTSKTVVQWVDEQIDAAIEGIEGITTEVMSWITGAWEWVRDKSGDVTDWIDEKSGEVWDWITGKGAEIEEWYDEQHEFLSDLFIEKREELADFLDDPGRFIADWVVDLLEYIFAEFVFRFW